MSDLEGELDALASETGFSGVVRIDQGDGIELARAYGLAHRAFEIPNAVDTRFGLASGAKGFTALAVHLPVRGSGDGGIYSTAADISSFWQAFFAGRIVSTGWVAEMVRARSDAPKHSKRYGLGFWLHASTDAVILEGCDAGVSFRSVHDPRTQVTLTVISNTAEGAWPIARYLQNAASS